MTPSFNFIICINLLKRVHGESSHGAFLCCVCTLACTHTRQRPPPPPPPPPPVDFCCTIQSEPVGHRTKVWSGLGVGTWPKLPTVPSKAELQTRAPRACCWAGENQDLMAETARAGFTHVTCHKTPWHCRENPGLAKEKESTPHKH